MAIGSNQLLRRPLGPHLAVLDQVRSVRDLEDFMHVVVGEQDADGLILNQSADDLSDVSLGERVHASEWLVKQNQIRLAHQAAGDFEPPLFAAGAAGRLVIANMRQTELFDHSFGPLPPLGPVQPLVETAAHRQHFEHCQDVLLDGELAKDRLLLRKVPMPSRARRYMGSRVTSCPLKTTLPS